jgi:RNA polymerase sigma-70 factor, ECF subfamily
MTLTKQRKTSPVRPARPPRDGGAAGAAPLSPRQLITLPSRDPDVALMLRAQRDEPGAFADLVGRFWTRIFGRFYRQFGDRQEAEDLTQEVFLRLYRSRKRYRPQARFATWLFHISQNVGRNAVRSRRRRPCVPLGRLSHPAADEQFVDNILPSRSEAPSRPMEQAELAGVVRTAVSGLAGRQRTAMELHQFQDRTYNQIAVELAMSPKAAKSLLYRARCQLRTSLTNFMDV